MNILHNFTVTRSSSTNADYVNIDFCIENILSVKIFNSYAKNKILTNIFKIPIDNYHKWQI